MRPTHRLIIYLLDGTITCFNIISDNDIFSILRRGLPKASIDFTSGGVLFASISYIVDEWKLPEANRMPSKLCAVFFHF